MSDPGRRHTLFVFWLKVLLPLGAVALLSTLFLFARSQNDAGGVPFAKLTELARETRLSKPHFSGVSADGITFALSAETIRPGAVSGQLFDVDQIILRLTAENGTAMTLSAGQATVDTQADTVRIRERARLLGSNGYVMETAGLTFDLKTGVIVSDGPLSIDAPFGDLNAGQLKVSGSASEPLHLNFTQGVEMVYLPRMKDRP